MTVARMHSQRQVQRGRDKSRYTGQKRIDRGGDDPNAGGGTVPATGATAGTPGQWTPPGSTPPATVAALQASSITASPATAWVTLQYVQTGTAGAPGEATWTGSGWVGGRAPAADPQSTDVDPSNPGNYTIAVIEAWVDAHPSEADEVLEAEEAGQQRVTLVSWLQGFISDRDEGHIP
jgi:hypothetical protein